MLSVQAFTSPVAQATLLPVAVDIDWHIGDVITKLRKRARMNQTVLAAKVGVNKATIVRAEDGDGKVSRETYLKIARVLKTDIAALESEAARLQAEQPDAIRQPSVSESHAARIVSAGSATNRQEVDGRGLAATPAPHVHPDPVSTTPAARNALGRSLIKAGTDLVAEALRNRAPGSRPAVPTPRPAKPALRKRRAGHR